MSIATLEARSRTIRIAPVSATPQATFMPHLGTQCSTCHLRDLCLPRDLSDEDVQQLDRLSLGRRRVGIGQTLYRAGDRFRFIYAVRSGTFKTSLGLPDGREQVSGFHLTGDLMGLDGAGSGVYVSSAIALEDTAVCMIPYSHLSELCARSGSLQGIVSRLMGAEIVREYGLMMLLGSMNAEERLAAFLLNLSKRMKARGYSPVEFHLRMSRAEIGSYLGMKLETVSRTFSAFQQQRLLEVDKRHIRIADLDGLKGVFEAQVLH